MPITAGFLILLALFVCALVALMAWSHRAAARIDAALPPQGLFVDIPGGRLHYDERLPDGPERATIVLLHGASGTCLDMILPLGDRLAARGFRVIAFDRPGLGWSDRPYGRRRDAAAVQARVLREALERLGCSSAIVVGHSLAGVIATNFALTQPDFVRGLVLLAPVTHPWPGGKLDFYYHLASAPVIGWLFTRSLTLPVGARVFDQALAGVFAPQPTPAGYADKTQVKLVLVPRRFHANAQEVADTYAFVRRQAPRLPEISAPTVIVTGDCDNIVLTEIHSRGSARDIPGARLEVLPDVGHSPHWAAPARVVAAIDELAQSLAQAGVAGSRISEIDVASAGRTAAE